MLTNNESLLGILQNVYETYKLAQEWNSEVIQSIILSDARVSYNNILNIMTYIMFELVGPDRYINVPFWTKHMHTVYWCMQNIRRLRPVGDT